MAAKIGKKSKTTTKAVKKTYATKKVAKNLKATSKKKVGYKSKSIIAKAKIKPKTKKTSVITIQSKKYSSKKPKVKTSSIKKITKKSVAKKIKKTQPKIINKPKDKDIVIEKKLSKSLSQTNTNDHQTRPTVDKEQLKLNNQAALSGPSKFQPYHIDVTEGYMNDQQLSHFENILETWKQELMLEVDNTIIEMKEADILADPNDRATQEETFNLELRTRDRERKLIKKIEAALKKINEQKYGYCDTCGVEIGVRRLEARPTATLCIECKTLSEIREKRA